MAKQNKAPEPPSLDPGEIMIPGDEVRKDKNNNEISPQAYFHMRNSVALFKEQKLDEAEEEMVKAIDIHPSLSPLYNVFGLLKIGRRAVNTLKQSVYMAMTTSSEYMDEFVKEGVELLAQEKFPEAEEKFKQAIALNPDNTDAHFRLGFTYISQKKYTDAIDAFEYLTQLDPHNVNAFFMLGLAYSEVREYYPCISNLQYALRIQPAFVEARLTLADAYHNQGKYLISMDELTRLEEYIPNEDTTYLHRGMILIELERFEEAIPYFEKVIELKPDVGEAYELLVGLYENFGNYERAMDLAKTALEINPQNPDMLAAVSRMEPKLNSEPAESES